MAAGRTSPPHILVANYETLELVLLRYLEFLDKICQSYLLEMVVRRRFIDIRSRIGTRIPYAQQSSTTLRYYIIIKLRC